MKLSNYEKETIINYSEGDKTASIYTHNEALKIRLIDICRENPVKARQTGDNHYGGLTFELPKRWIKISPPRVLSPAQQKVLEEMNRKKREIATDTDS